MKAIQILVWAIVVLTLFLVTADTEAELESIYLFLKVVIEFFLLIMGGFQILKTTPTTPNDSVQVIRFRQKSKRFNQLIWFGVVLTLSDFVLIDHYAFLLSTDTILVAILFVYYAGQLLFQNRPSLYFSSDGLTFDDFFPKNWIWDQINLISIDGQNLLINDGKEYIISLEGIDEDDPELTKVELDAQILDGSSYFEDDPSNLKKMLEDSSAKYGFRLD